MFHASVLRRISCSVLLVPTCGIYIFWFITTYAYQIALWALSSKTTQSSQASAKGQNFLPTNAVGPSRNSHARSVITSTTTVATVHQQCSATSTSMASTPQDCLPTCAVRTRRGLPAQMPRAPSLPMVANEPKAARLFWLPSCLDW